MVRTTEWRLLAVLLLASWRLPGPLEASELADTDYESTGTDTELEWQENSEHEVAVKPSAPDNVTHVELAAAPHDNKPRQNKNPRQRPNSKQLHRNKPKNGAAKKQPQVSNQRPRLRNNNRPGRRPSPRMSRPVVTSAPQTSAPPPPLLGDRRFLTTQAFNALQLDYVRNRNRNTGRNNNKRILSNNNRDPFATPNFGNLRRGQTRSPRITGSTVKQTTLSDDEYYDDSTTPNSAAPAKRNGDMHSAVEQPTEASAQVPPTNPIVVNPNVENIQGKPSEESDKSSGPPKPPANAGKDSAKPGESKDNKGDKHEESKGGEKKKKGDDEEEEEKEVDQKSVDQFRENSNMVNNITGRDIPMWLYRCSLNSSVDADDDCESDAYFLQVSDKVLKKKEVLKEDMELLDKIYTRLLKINITWPEDYNFDKSNFVQKLADINKIFKSNKDEEKEEELALYHYYKLIQDMFKPVQQATHKPGDIFVTDVVREIVKLQNVFLKRKVLDYLFRILMDDKYRGEEHEAS